MSALGASGTLQDQHLDSVLSHPVVHAKMQELNRKLQRLHQSGGSRAAHSGGGEAMQKLSQLLKHTAGDLRGRRMVDAESESESHSTMDGEMDPSEIEHQGVMEKLDEIHNHLLSRAATEKLGKAGDEGSSRAHQRMDGLEAKLDKLLKLHQESTKTQAAAVQALQAQAVSPKDLDTVVAQVGRIEKLTKTDAVKSPAPVDAAAAAVEPPAPV